MTAEWHGGKGSKPRPYSITQEEYNNRWDAIFGRDQPDEDTDELDEENELDDEDFDENEHTEEK
jgi:hypothetical protein